MAGRASGLSKKPGGRRPVNRAALNMNALIAQMHLLLNGLLDDVAPHPYTAPTDFALPDPKLLLVNRDDLFVMTRGTCRRSTRTRAGRGWRMSGHPAVQQALRNPYFDGLGL